MNAYELEDKLQELDSRLHLIDLFKSANMLRQQADRIAKLENEITFRKGIYEDLCNVIDEYKKLTPQTKPLSDEEIMEIKTLMEINYGCVPPLEFAWAIEAKVRGEK